MKKQISRKATCLELIENLNVAFTNLRKSSQISRKNLILKKIDNLSCELGKKLSLDIETAKVFAIIFLFQLEGEEASTLKIAEITQVKLRDYPIIIDAIEKLSAAGLIIANTNWMDRKKFHLTTEVMDTLFKNEIPNTIPSVLNTIALSELSNKTLSLLQKNQINLEQAACQLKKYTSLNQELAFSKIINKLKPNEIDTILLFTLFQMTFEGYQEINILGIGNELINNHMERIKFRNGILNNENIIFKNEFVEWQEGAFKVNECVVLTSKGKDAFYGEEAAILAPEIGSFKKDVLLSFSIKEKILVFNSREREELERIEKLLSKDNYNSIIQKLKTKNMSAGVSILFYGSPGTGKTESVLQLAKKTGRDIKQIDLSSIRDKYIGESEKNVRAIFKDYNKLCKACEETPILLLNEADALINNRISVQQSADQMNNSMQNIFLEEMEKFEGILIATTNLEKNMDAAFDRRFLYKIKFENPDVSVRAKIMQERIPLLTNSECNELAQLYELSGGQIENVARKVMAESLYMNHEINVDSIMQFCKQEASYRQATTGKNKMGF